MSYPPPYNGQYPPHYLQNIPPNQPHPARTPSSQQQYNSSPNEQYQQYAKSFVYPQVPVPSYQTIYGSPLLQQQHAHHQIHPQTTRPPPAPPPQHPLQQQQQILQSGPPLQFVNPAQTTFSPSPIHGGVSSTALFSQYIHGPSPPSPPRPQYGGVPTASPSLPTAPSPAPYYNVPSPRQPNNNDYVQYSSTTQSPSVQPPPVSRPTAAAPPRPAGQLPKTLIPSPMPASPVTLIPQVVVPSPSHSKMPSKTTTPAPSTKSQPIQNPASDIDYQTLLLALADEYLTAAHSRGTLLALSKNEMELEEYYKLVGTGLGCLEAVQRKFRSEPRIEALVRLRYARILIEETDNNLEAETALSKGIEVCERNKLVDLKYTMQQLLARMLFKSNPKAAVKTVDGMIQDVETYRHVPWEYAFRLLRVTLALSSGSHQEFVAAIHNLHKLSNLANRNADKLVAVVAAVIEALAHLQQSASPDSIEQAQRAIATARSHQLDPTVRDILQISTMVHMVDISCSLLEYDLNQSSQKLQIMQNLMDQRVNDSRWGDDGSFTIPLNSKPTASSAAETSDILHVEDGRLCLTLNWLPQHDLYALCFFLSSVTLSAKNPHNGRKAEEYLKEGLRMIRGSFKKPEEITESLVAAGRRLEWRRIVHCNMLLHHIFLVCARSDWEVASETLKELGRMAEELGAALPDTVQCLIQYATGAIAQGTGDLVAALAAFESPILSLAQSSGRATRNDPRRDTAILAALNTILILREPSNPSHFRLPQVLSTVEPLCLSSSNKYIQAAYYLVCATVQTDSTIQTKQYLQHALQSATVISNSQITCMTLTFMSWKYFRGVVGEQSEKSARAGRAMAKKANDRLWISVTDEMLAETLDRQGKSDEAKIVRDEAGRAMMGLPPALKHTEYR